MSRPHHPADYAALKAATHRAVELAGPLSEITKRTRLDGATISRAGNPHESNFLPLDVALDLDALSGDDCILRAMATLRGYELVPTELKKSHDDLERHVGDIARESGEMISEALNAVSDGALTPAEATKIEKEAAEVASIVHRVRNHMHGIIATVSRQTA